MQLRSSIVVLFCFAPLVGIARGAEHDPNAPDADRFVVAPFVGVNAPVAGNLGSGSLDSGVGPRIGAIVGRKVAPHWSVDGQVTFDLLDLRVPVATHAFLVRADLSPLFHWAGPDGELLAGPVIGAWRYVAETNESAPFVSRHEVVTDGFTYGANVGVLTSMPGDHAVGVLVSLAIHHRLDLCQTLAYAGFSCDPDPSRSLAVVGVTLVLSL